MATGILAIGLGSAGYRILSLIALAAATALWIPLAASYLADLTRGGHRWARPADAPAALTAVAATTVLGTRLSLLGWHAAGGVLLILAAAAWPAPVIKELRRGKHRLAGASFLACVATQGLAVLAGALAAAGDGAWLAIAALVLLCLGLLLYIDVSARFDLREVRQGHGDQWVAAGAAAIGALAASQLTASSAFAGGAHTALRITTWTLLALDLGGYAILLTAEVHWPRLHYDIRRWATVFPLGMTAAASLSTASTTGITWLHGLGVVLLWAATAAWLALLTDTLAQTRHNRQTERPAR